MQQHWILPAQTPASVRNHHSSLSCHCKTTPVKISLKQLDQSLGLKLIGQWCGNLLVVLFRFYLMGDLVLFSNIWS